ncbi:MAG: hypothetical protein J6D28_00820 [Bacilli bacterium]|nr:hypothetical protein [Bacilli bacterium]
MKRKFFKILENTLCTVLTILIYGCGNIAFMVAGIPILLVFSSKLVNLISQNKIRDSIFSVSSKGVIKQNSLANPIRFIKLLMSKDKHMSFMNEAESMFKQLPRMNKNGDIIRYKTLSHAFTFRLLKQLEGDGYITNLVKEKEKKSNLIFEKLLIGNTSNLSRKKTMYKISFELTEKKFGDTDSNNLVVNSSLNDDLSCDKRNRRQEIAELTALKNQLLGERSDTKECVKKY